MKKPLFTEIINLPGLIPAESRMCGLDVGSKTIGIAISDRLQTIATPHKTLQRTKLTKDLAFIKELADKEAISAFAVGYPVNMDGSDGPRCQATRQFARDLLAATQVPVVLWDERMSSNVAERVMLEGDLSRQRRSELIDKMAASYILQGALDRLKHVKKT